MKQYQFKTTGAAYLSKNGHAGLNSQINSKVESSVLKKVEYSVSTSLEKPFIGSTNNTDTSDLTAGNKNINDMKSKLNELLKQTDMLTEKQNNSANKMSSDTQPKYTVNSSYSFNSEIKTNQFPSKSLNNSIGGRADQFWPKFELSHNINKDLYNSNDYAFGISKENKNIPTQKPLSSITSSNNFINSYSNQSISNKLQPVQSSKQPVKKGQSPSKAYTNYNEKTLQPRNPLRQNSQSKTLKARPYTLQQNNLSKQTQSKVQQPKTSLEKTNINNPIQKSSQISTQTSLPSASSLQDKEKEYNNNFAKKESANKSFQYGVQEQSNYGQRDKKIQKPLQIPNNLNECQYKLRIIDKEFQKIKQELKDMADGKQYYRKELSQEWRNNKKLKEDYELKISQIKKEHEREIKKLQESKETKQKQLFQIIASKDKNIISLVNEVAQAKVTTTYECYDEKTKLVLESNQTLVESLTKIELENTELKSQIVKKDVIIDQLNQKLKSLEDQVKFLNNFKEQKINSQLQNFDQILKVQLKSIAEFKEVVERLNQKNNQLREKLVQSSRKNEYLSNEIRIVELKHRANLNNFIMQSAVEQSNKQNTINSLNKKVTTIEQKYKSAVNEIKSKDEFLKQHLIGRTDSIDVKEYIENVLVKYRQHFAESKQDQLKADLEKALKKIEMYEKYG